MLCHFSVRWLNALALHFSIACCSANSRCHYLIDNSLIHFRLLNECFATSLLYFFCISLVIYSYFLIHICIPYNLECFSVCNISWIPNLLYNSKRMCNPSYVTSSVQYELLYWKSNFVRSSYTITHSQNRAAYTHTCTNQTTKHKHTQCVTTHMSIRSNFGLSFGFCFDS